MKPDRGEKPSEENPEAIRGRFMGYKKRNHYCNIKMQGEAASANVEATVSYSEDLAKKINEGNYTKQHSM